MLSLSQKLFCFRPYVMAVCFFILLNVVGVDYQHIRSCVLLLVILTNQIWFTSLCIWQITMLFGTPGRYLPHSNDSRFFILVVLRTTVVIFGTGFGYKYKRTFRKRPSKIQRFSGRLWDVVACERSVADGGSIVVLLSNCNKQRFLFELFYFLVSFVLGCSFWILIYSSSLQRAAGTLPSQNHSKAVQVIY